LLPDPVLLKCSLMIALCACFVIAQACRKQERKSPDLTFAPEISPQPPRVGKVTLTLNIKDASGAPVAGARLNLEGNMSHAGMVPVFAEASEIGPGRYRSVMELSMAGDWNVTVHMTLSDDRKLDHEFEIKGVEPRISTD
jgi:YtkA-like protein